VLIWETISKSLALRPASVTNPLVIAVQHHKTEEQIPAEYQALWTALRVGPHSNRERVALEYEQ